MPSWQYHAYVLLTPKKVEIQGLILKYSLFLYYNWFSQNIKNSWRKYFIFFSSHTTVRGETALSTSSPWLLTSTDTNSVTSTSTSSNPTSTTRMGGCFALDSWSSFSFLYYSFFLTILLSSDTPAGETASSTSSSDSTLVLYMSFDKFLLAVESRDLSQADKSNIRVSSFPKLCNG